MAVGLQAVPSAPVSKNLCATHCVLYRKPDLLEMLLWTCHVSWTALPQAPVLNPCDSMLGALGS